MKTVCVTGATGFIASQLVKQLLQLGYKVHATVRDLNKTAHLTSLPNADQSTLRLFEADLMQQGSFDAAFEHCEGIFHTACPVLVTTTEQNTVPLAVDGTLNVLHSAVKFPSIRKIVMTSSIAACVIPPSAGQIYTEQDWSDVDFLRNNQQWYGLGKTMGEKKAFEFVNSHQGCNFSLVTILPAFTYGEVLRPVVNSSIKAAVDYLNGDSTEIQNRIRSIVDVKDVAKAHILAFEDNDACGRYLCSGTMISDLNLCQKLLHICPNSKVPTKPTSFESPPLSYEICDEKVQRLGLTFRSLDDTLKDIVNSTNKLGLINK